MVIARRTLQLPDHSMLQKDPRPPRPNFSFRYALTAKQVSCELQPSKRCTDIRHIDQGWGDAEIFDGGGSRSRCWRGADYGTSDGAAGSDLDRRFDPEDGAAVGRVRMGDVGR